jgi:hypothetical protein
MKTTLAILIAMCAVRVAFLLHAQSHNTLEGRPQLEIPTANDKSLRLNPFTMTWEAKANIVLLRRDAVRNYHMIDFRNGYFRLQTNYIIGFLDGTNEVELLKISKP